MNQNKLPREIIINRALINPDHIWGVERKLVLLVVLISSTMMGLSITLPFWTKAFAIGFFVFCYTSLKLMAKADPVLSQIYLRHIKYKGYYLSHSTPYCAFSKTYKR